jgi:peptidylprolyl isomerase
VCIILFLAVTSTNSGASNSYQDGYRYGSSAAVRLDSSQAPIACGGDAIVPSGDDVAEWRKGCDAGFGHARGTPPDHGSTALPPSASGSTTPTTAAPAPAPTSTEPASPATTAPPRGPIEDLSPAGTFGVQPTVVVPPGAPPGRLESADLITGIGPGAKDGDNLIVEYIAASYSTGKVVESSWNGQPFPFTLGTNQVIPGWNEGLIGMQVGGRRELIVPPSLGYGARPPVPGITSDDTLVFIVDLLSINADSGAGGNSGAGNTGNFGPTGSGDTGGTGNTGNT